MASHEEDDLLKAVALQNASTILKARQKAEQELVDARDALERKTEELAVSLAMMKATLDSATDGILVTDARRRITGYNEKLVQMWQLPPAALQAGDHGELLDAMGASFERPHEFRTLVEAIYRAAPPTSFDLLRTSDGRVIERQSRPQVIEGRIVGRVWSFRDITQQRKAEQALRDESSMLELLNRTGPSLLSRLDLRSVVQAVTDAGTQISGAKYGAFFYNVIEKNGESLLLYTLSGAPREAFAHLGKPRPTPVFGPTFNGMAPIRSDDIRKDARYGQWAPHHGMPVGHLPVRSYLAVPVIGGSGEVLGSLFFGHPDPGVFNERSERVIVGIAAQAAVAIDNARLYEAARESAEERKRLLESERSARALAERMSALKDDLLATLSHELRTPLGAILGWVHILRRGGGRKPGEMQKALDTIERNARRQVQLIEDLLDMNRITSGKIRQDMQAVPPGPVGDTSGTRTVHPARDFTGLTLLVVDDDDDGRELARRMLQECEAEVLTAASAAEAVSLVQRHRPHVMISDIGMPGEDGYSLLRRVRDLDDMLGGALPVIALTAFARPEDRAQVLAAGFAAHLTRPVEPDQLLSAVAAAAGRA